MGQFQEIHPPDKLSGHDFRKGNFESTRKDASDFAKDRLLR